MKKIVLTMIFTLFVMAKVSADPVGLYLGGQAWQTQASGALGEKNALTEFELEKKPHGNYFVAIEHPFPLLPNLRIATSVLDTTGAANLAYAFGFAGELFAKGTRTDVDLAASYVDYTLYYELFDNDLFAVELGATARDLNSTITMTGITTRKCYQTAEGRLCLFDSDADNTMAVAENDDMQFMLYANTRVAFPLTGVSAFVQSNIALLGAHSLYDYQLGLSYAVIDSMLMDLNLTLGYQSVHLELKNLNPVYTDLAFTGAFLGVVLHF